MGPNGQVNERTRKPNESSESRVVQAGAVHIEIVSFIAID